MVGEKPVHILFKTTGYLCYTNELSYPKLKMLYIEISGILHKNAKPRFGKTRINLYKFGFLNRIDFDTLLNMRV